MNALTELFSRTFIQQIEVFGAIMGHRRLVREGLPLSHAQQMEKNTRIVLEMLQSPKERKIFYDPDSLLRGGYEKMAARMTKSQFERTERMTDASCFVFGHSVLDSGIYDFCRVLFLASPDSVIDHVGEKKMKMSEALSLDRSAILKKAENSALADLKYSSLLKKLDLLLRFLKPDAAHPSISHYSYDRNKIESIDKRRHEIVHGLEFHTPLDDCDGDLVYMEKTALHIASLLNWRFGLRVDVSVANSPR